MTPCWMGCGGQIAPHQLEAFEATGQYVAEPKRDGIWAVCMANGTQRFFSRQGKEKSIHEMPTLPAGTIVVGELGYGSQAACQRRKHLGHPFLDVFDLLAVGGRDVSGLDDNVRRTILEATWASWSLDVQAAFPLVPRICTGFRALYKTEAEGIVLKQVQDRPSHPYVSDSRNPYWLKVKRQFSVDMVLMGFQLSAADSYKGLPIAKHVTCGVYTHDTLVPLVNVGAFSMALKRDIVHRWEQYRGKVAELACFQVFASGALRHPSLVKVRTDKRPEECTWEALCQLRHLSNHP